MLGSLTPVWGWLGHTYWATAIRTSSWLYPFIQLIHFTGLSLWLGTITIADMRLIGVGPRRQTVERVCDTLFWWNWIGFCIVVLGGFLLFSSRATLYIANPAFRLKLGILIPVALLWHLFVQYRTPKWGQLLTTPAVVKLAGLIELLLWIGVVTAAVNIPTYY